MTGTPPQGSELQPSTLLPIITNSVFLPTTPSVQFGCAHSPAIFDWISYNLNSPSIHGALKLQCTHSGCYQISIWTMKSPSVFKLLASVHFVMSLLTLYHGAHHITEDWRLATLSTTAINVGRKANIYTLSITIIIISSDYKIVHF